MTNGIKKSKTISIFVWGIFLLMVNFSARADEAAMNQSVISLQTQWAIINYQEKDEEQQKQDIAQLADRAEQISHDNPDQAEPLIWQAIIISTKAEIEGGLPALHDAEHARDLLLQAENIDPSASQGIIYTSLGVLYYKVPGWPVGFGDKKRAQEYLEKGLALNTNGLDQNFFYGDFLYEMGDYVKAKDVLEHGLKATLNLQNEVADRGRREEMRSILSEVNKKIAP